MHVFDVKAATLIPYSINYKVKTTSMLVLRRLERAVNLIDGRCLHVDEIDKIDGNSKLYSTLKYLHSITQYF